MPSLPAEVARANGKLGGRPKGSKGQRAKLSEYKARELLAKNESPLDIMIDNMLYWRRAAKRYGIKLEANDELLKTYQHVKVTEETLKEFMDLLRKNVELGDLMIDAREKSQDCAVDAAPYVHPRLNALAVKDFRTPKGRVKFSLQIGDKGQLKSVELEVNGRKPLNGTTVSDDIEVVGATTE